MATDTGTTVDELVSPARALTQRLHDDVDTWRRVLASAGDADQRTRSGWSPIEHAVRLCDFWHQKADQINLVRMELRPVLEHVLIDAPRAYVPGVATVLTRLVQEAGALGHIGASISAAEWDRTGLGKEGAVTIAVLFGDCLTESDRLLAAATRLVEPRRDRQS